MTFLVTAVAVFATACIACAVADHHCSGNIVQALSKCASAIQGGESLDSQQEKCAPDGCNYDCPSVDLINGLQVDLSEANTRIDTLQDLTGTIVTNYTGQISSIKQQINDIPISCQEVKARWPDSPSGIYLITLPGGDTGYVYCHLGNLCGSSDGWMRIAYLDMTDPAQECPSAFDTVIQNGVKCCGRKENVASCDGLFFSSKGTSYSEICGRVTGYQWGSPDAINDGNADHNNIESQYVDGVSITYGSPRQHVWTFIASVYEQHSGPSTCPCNSGNSFTTQDFIGDDYFCESGNPNTGWSKQLYSDDRLWDGFNCGNLETSCCNAEGLPWFYKQLSSPITEDIELRVCGDQGQVDEDNPIDAYEIYIK